MEIGFRLMTPADLPALIGWQRTPAAAPWFSAPADLAEAEARYGGRLRGEHPTRMYVVQLAAGQRGGGTWRDVGFLQAYRLGEVPWVVADVADPEAVGLDFLIGVPELIGQGVGTAMIGAFLATVVPVDFPGAPAAVSAPSHRNLASRRVLAANGFTEGLWVDEPGGAAGPGGRARTADTLVVCTRRLP